MFQGRESRSNDNLRVWPQFPDCANEAESIGARQAGLHEDNISPPLGKNVENLIACLGGQNRKIFTHKNLVMEL